MSDPLALRPEEWRAIRVIGAYQHVHECAWRIEAFGGAHAPIMDVTITIALLESCFMRGRHLIEFFMGGGSDAVHVSTFAPQWSLPKEVGRELEIERQHISTNLAHMLETPTGDGGYRVRALIETIDAAMEALAAELERVGSEHAQIFRYQVDWQKRLCGTTGPDRAQIFAEPGGPWRPDLAE